MGARRRNGARARAGAGVRDRPRRGRRPAARARCAPGRTASTSPACTRRAAPRGARARRAATTSATVVQRLEAAGAISLGKLAMTQLAWGMMGQTPGRPACRNPHDPERVPGGSSSGSAVAVATGIVDCAPGTDAGGSVRHPAAACGVVGFKPTYGAVPLDGCMPYAPSFDTGGPIARTVAEAALQYAVIAGRAARRPDRRARRAARRLPGRLLHGRARGRRRRDARSSRASACARVRSTSRGRRPTTARWAPIFTAEPGAFVLAHDPQPEPAQATTRRRSPTSRARARCRRSTTCDAHRELAEAQRALRRRRPTATTSCSAPSAPCAPVRDRRPRQDDAHERAHEALQRPAAGPPLSLPGGRDRDGLPLGLQVVSTPGRDDAVLRAAAPIERLLA